MFPLNPHSYPCFFHLYEADIGQYCSLDKELGRYHSSLLAHYNPSLLHTSHLYKRGCKRRAAGCVLPVLIPQNRRLKVRFFPALLLSFSWEDKFWDLAVELSSQSKALSLSRSLHTEQGKPNAWVRQIEVQCWDIFDPNLGTCMGFGYNPSQGNKTWIQWGTSDEGSLCCLTVIQVGCDGLILQNKTRTVTMLHPVRIWHLRLEKVEEETQKPDGSCGAPLRYISCSSLQKTGKQIVWFQLTKAV